jgi:hypothetical protein
MFSPKPELFLHEKSALFQNIYQNLLSKPYIVHINYELIDRKIMTCKPLFVLNIIMIYK